MSRLNKKYYFGIAIILILIFLLGVIWYLQPRTPEALLARAEKAYIRNELVTKNLSGKVISKEKLQKLWVKNIRFYQDVINRFPKSNEAIIALFKQGVIYEEKLVQIDNAIKTYKTLIDKYPESETATDALYRRALLLSDKKKDGKAKIEAVEDLKRLVNKSPTSPLASKAQYKIGSVYEEIKEYQRAVNEYQKVVDNYPATEDAPQAQYRIAQIAQDHLSQKKMAQTAYQKLQEKYPDSKYAKLAPALKGKLMAEEDSANAAEKTRKYYGNQPVDPYSHSFRREELLLEEKVRSGNMDIQNYRLNVQINPPENTLFVRCDMDILNQGEVTNEINLKLNQTLKVSKASINENPVKIEKDGNHIKILSPKKIKQNEISKIHLEYSGKQDDSLSWTGDKIRPEGVFLRFESKWYPQGSWGDMATNETMIEVPIGYTAVAGGGFVEKKELDESVLYHWKSDIPLFGLMLVARNYVVDEDTFDGKPLMTLLYKLHANKSKAYLDETKKIMEFYSEKFGPYIYPKLAIAEIPYFPGGYGSPSLVMLTDKSFESEEVPVSLLAHELAHQWWGNLLSIRLREDSIPWLSEGFATYSDCLYLEQRSGRDEMIKHLNELSEIYRETAIQGNDDSILSSKWGTASYQPVVYYKGAYVLHTLRYLVGDEKFFKILRDYSKQYAGNNITVKDFQSVCEKSYGQKLDWFFEQWLGRSGLPTFTLSKPNLVKNGNGYRISAEIVQEGTIYRSPLDVTVITVKGPVTKRIQINQMVTSIEINTDSEPLSLELDKDNWILQKKKITDDTRKIVLKK